MGQVHRGDLVAFRYGTPWARTSLGLPGDRIRVESGKLIRTVKRSSNPVASSRSWNYWEFPLAEGRRFYGYLQF